MLPKLYVAWDSLTIVGGATAHMTGTNWLFGSSPRVVAAYVKGGQPFLGAHETMLLQSLTATVPDYWSSSQVAFFIANEVMNNSDIVTAAGRWRMSPSDRDLAAMTDRVAALQKACDQIGKALNLGVEVAVGLIPGGTIAVTVNNVFQRKYLAAIIGAVALVPWGKVGEAIAAKIVFTDGSEILIGAKTAEAISEMSAGERALLVTEVNEASSAKDAADAIKLFVGIRYEAHHLLPQAEIFEKYFSKAGLSIEDYVLYIEKAVHRLTPEGVHTVAGGNWNRVWEQFFDKYPDATKPQILEKLGQMLKDFGLE
jgi:hypothetical protein